MITEEEILKAAKCCAQGGCWNCPLADVSSCGAIFADYIQKNVSKPINENTSSTESNTNTICENAQITDVSLGIDDHLRKRKSNTSFLHILEIISRRLSTLH